LSIITKIVLTTKNGQLISKYYVACMMDRVSNEMISNLPLRHVGLVAVSLAVDFQQQDGDSLSFSSWRPMSRRMSRRIPPSAGPPAQCVAADLSSSFLCSSAVVLDLQQEDYPTMQQDEQQPIQPQLRQPLR
jgi:hypothetical protein